MRRRFLNLVVLSTLMLSLVFSCTDDTDTPLQQQNPEQTIFMYFPWSGSDIYPYFEKNISSFEKAIRNNNGLGNNRCIAFISSSATTAYLINIYFDGKVCKRDTIKKYDFNKPIFTTETGIASIIQDATISPYTKKWAMIIGCHGMGWIPKGTRIENVANISKLKKSDKIQLTRYFGHSSDASCQTDISTLAKGIELSGKKMNYILFDDCYMSNIETAFELKDATNFLIASTSEIMIEGMPYEVIGKDLLNSNLEGVCKGFYSFYSNFTTPCGTIGVTDCREIDNMAELIKRINSKYPNASENVYGLQTLDGFTPAIFFDFGSYVEKICKDETLKEEFKERLAKLVPYKANTKTYYSMYTQARKEIKTFSGVTISDPTNNAFVAQEVKETSWYKATH